jgi:hypothetical protein
VTHLWPPSEAFEDFPASARPPVDHDLRIGRILLDTNCLIDLAEGGEVGEILAGLVADLRTRGHGMAVAAITASENPRKGSPPKTWPEFVDLLSRVGLADAEILKPMGYWDVTFWGEGLWVGDDMIALETQIHIVLFPSFAIDDDSDPGRWRNAKCDVQVVWTAMWNRVDFLITSDRRIVDRAPRLASIRPIEILTPAEFSEMREGHPDPPPGSAV